MEGKGKLSLTKKIFEWDKTKKPRCLYPRLVLETACDSRVFSFVYTLSTQFLKNITKPSYYRKKTLSNISLNLKLLQFVTRILEIWSYIQGLLRKKGQGQIHWKGHYIFTFRAPCFCTAIGSAWYSWRVWECCTPPCRGLAAEPPEIFLNFNYSKCSETYYGG